jgi:hypothetical protein
MKKKDQISFISKLSCILISLICLLSEIYLRIQGLETPDFIIWEISFPGLLTIAISGLTLLGIPAFKPAIKTVLNIYKNIKGKNNNGDSIPND